MCGAVLVASIPSKALNRGTDTGATAAVPVVKSGTCSRVVRELDEE
jgi:hypothetical protein